MQIFYPYHIVKLSPWPLMVSVSALGLGISIILSLNNYELGVIGLYSSISLLIFSMLLWFKDIIRESTLLGYHTRLVTKGLKIGFYLFLVSELMIFFGFFWGYFHSSLCPTVELGCNWPPLEIKVFNPLEVPLLNTIILLSSGIACTWSHSAIINGNLKEGKLSLRLTILLGILFSIFQGIEYIEAPFTISDGVYGSVFYILTGLHGFHVILGTILLIVTGIRLSLNQLTIQKHWGFEYSSYYWHAVDIVWLYLYVFVYYWGS